jgi:hypothetical protein
MSLKSDFECSYCFRILKNPRILPCSDNICDEHLSDTLLLNSNTIICQACRGEFDINEKNLTPNLRLQSLINKDVHLTSREKSMKKSLEDSLKIFFDLLSQIEQSINVSISESQRHFEEIRRKIVIQQNKLKTKIDK